MMQTKTGTQSISKNAVMVLVLGAVCAAGTARAQMQPTAVEGAQRQRPAMMTDGDGMGGGPADPQVKDELMDGLDKLGANAKERNEVNLDKDMMALVGSRKGGRYADMSQKMDFIVVRNYEFAQKGQYQKADLDQLRKKLDSAGWSHLVRNDSGDETNDIVVKSAGDGYISDMVVLNAEAKELNIVHMRGHFRMEDVSSAMGSAMGVMSTGAMGMAMGHMGGSSGSHVVMQAPPTPPAPPAAPAEAKK
jgi:hypothetical protein